MAKSKHSAEREVYMAGARKHRFRNARRLWGIVYRMVKTTRTPPRTMTFPTVRYTIG